jgi:hypothetical protein
MWERKIRPDNWVEDFRIVPLARPTSIRVVNPATAPRIIQVALKVRV